MNSGNQKRRWNHFVQTLSNNNFRPQVSSSHQNFIDSRLYLFIFIHVYLQLYIYIYLHIYLNLQDDPLRYHVAEQKPHLHVRVNYPTKTTTSRSQKKNEVFQSAHNPKKNARLLGWSDLKCSVKNADIPDQLFSEVRNAGKLTDAFGPTKNPLLFPGPKLVENSGISVTNGNQDDPDIPSQKKSIYIINVDGRNPANHPKCIKPPCKSNGDLNLPYHLSSLRDFWFCIAGPNAAAS